MDVDILGEVCPEISNESLACRSSESEATWELEALVPSHRHGVPDGEHPTSFFDRIPPERHYGEDGTEADWLKGALPCDMGAFFVSPPVGVSAGEQLCSLFAALCLHTLAVMALVLWLQVFPRPAADYPVLMVNLSSLGEPGGGPGGTERPGSTLSGAHPQGSGAESPTAESSPPALVEPEPLSLAEPPREEPVQRALQDPMKTPPLDPAPQIEKAPPKKKPPRRDTSTPRREAKLQPSGTPVGKEPAPDGPPSSSGTGPWGAPGSGSGRAGIEIPGERSGGAGGSPLREFQLAQVDRAPVVVSKAEPDYPYRARRQNITGKVLVKFLVDPQGRVQKPCIVKAEPQGVFESCVLEAIGKWRFKPGYYKGQAVSTWVVVPIQFRLSG